MAPKRSWTQREYDRMRKNCISLQKARRSALSVQRTMNAGDCVAVDYFALGEVLDFFRDADEDFQRLVKARETLALMHLPDA